MLNSILVAAYFEGVQLPWPFAFLILLGLGLLLFYGGFQNYRKFRVLEDSPIMPIRSIPMGFVHVRGAARGEERLTSPLTHVPCYYYKVLVERQTKDEGGQEHWVALLRDVNKVKFYLEDATGRVLVDPHLAQLDLDATLVIESDRFGTTTQGLDPLAGFKSPPKQNELLDYFSKTTLRLRTETASVHGMAALRKFTDMEQGYGFPSLNQTWQGGDLSSERLRFTETCLLAGREYNVAGTCAENPSPKDAHDRNMLMRGRNEPTFVISGKTEQALERQTRSSGFLAILIGTALILGSVALLLGKLGAF